MAALREAALTVVVAQWWGSGDGGGGGGGGVSCGEGGGEAGGEGGGGSGEAHLAREKVVDPKLVKVECPPRLLARLRDCVRADL